MDMMTEQGTGDHMQEMMAMLDSMMQQMGEMKARMQAMMGGSPDEAAPDAMRRGYAMGKGPKVGY